MSLGTTLDTLHRSLKCASQPSRPRCKTLWSTVLLLFAIPWGLTQTTTTDENVLFRWQGLDEPAWTVMHQFFEYDRYLPHNGRVVSVTDHHTYYRREKLVFDGADGARVPAWLAIPKIRAAPYPLVILLHDLGGSKQDFYEDDAYWGFDLTRKLVASGFAVLTPDARHHGERIGFNDYQAPDEVAMKKGHLNAYRKTLVSGVVDCRRALDYLRSRNDINMGRIGVLGYGMGGVQVFMLAALDRRIKTGIACVAPLYKQQHAVFAAHNYADRLGETPFLLLLADRDEGYTHNDVKRLLALMSPPKEKVFYDSDHRLPKPYTARAVRFLKAQLGQWDEEPTAADPGQ